MIAKLLIAITIFSIETSNVMAQRQDTCVVVLKAISGVYKGKCKNGLANGKGTAKGEDTYIGTFKNGLPDGKGRYLYNNGNIYSGYFQNGVKNGSGKFIYYINGKKTVQRGYWKDDNYVGYLNPDEFYRVTNQTGIDSYSIKKIDDNGAQIKITFVGAMTKHIPQDIRITTTSGQLNKETKNFSIYNFICPNNCNIHYIIKTAGGNWECNFSFDILKPGKYEITITNN